MINDKYTSPLLDQTKDLIWIVDNKFNLVYANRTYLNLMKQVTGKEKKMNEPVLIEGFGEGYIEKWKGYYSRALSGEQFELEEHYSHPNTNEIQYGQIIFNPIRDENNQVVAVACQSRDITRIVKQRSDAHQLMDASLDVFCTINEAGNFVFVSEAASQLWGYSPIELIGVPHMSLVIKEDIPKTNNMTNAILNGEEIKSFVNRYKRKDGAIAYNLWSARWDSEAKLMYCVARDAKENIEQENLLQQSEQRFKALVQEGADLIAILDSNGIYRYVSPTSFTVLGMQPEEFLGRSPFEFIHPDDAERTLASLQKITEQQKVQVEPFRFKNNKNEWRWIDTVLTNMLDNPALGGIVANSRDITAKKDEEQRLKLLESVITNTNDAVLITEAEPFDKPGPRILYVNEAFTRMTGYTAEEVIGKSPRILQGPKSDKAELARLSKAMRNWEPCEITTINYKKNGEEFWINLSISPVADETGWYTHWISIERDVTEKKKLELSKDLNAKISALFNIEPDVSSALSKLCEEVTAIGQFSFCEIWLTDIQESLLELKAVHKNDDAATIFYENSKPDKVVERGQGTHGKIWENSKSIIWEHRGKNQELLFRYEAAEKAGIKTIVGFPLKYHDKFIGVLQFGTKAITKNVEWIINVLEELGAFIGAEVARKKTEIEHTKIFEFAPDIIATCGFDGFYKKINPYTTTLLGYTEKEFTSKPLTDFLHPDDAQITAAQLNKLSSGAPIYNFKNRYVTKTGEIKTINWNSSPSVEDSLIFCIGKDITEEIKIGRLLKESNQLSRIGSWEVDLIKNSIFWSEITHEIHEAPEKFKPQLSEAINFYREDFRELTTQAVNACIETGTPFDFEAIIVTTKNNEVWVRAMGRAEMVNGKCTRIYGSFQDINTRKLAELNQLKLIEEKTNILESIGDAFYALDSELNFTYMNSSCANLIADKKEKIIGKNLFTEFPDLKNTLFEDELRKVQHTAKATKFEFYYAPFDAWFEESIYPTPTGISVYFVDITQRKNANAEISKSEEKRKLIMNGALDAIITIDTNETITFWNAQAEGIFGWKAEEMMGKKLSETIIPEHFRKYHVEGLKNYLKTGEGKALNVLLELSAIRRNGEEFPIELTVIPIKQGSEEFFCAFIRDITQRKNSESKLIENENYLRTILDNEPECVKILNSKGELLSMNPAGLAMIEADNEQQVLGHRMTDLVNKEYQLGFNRLTKEVFKGNPGSFEFEITGLKGGCRWLETHAVPLKDTTGKIVNLLGVTRDITERKKAERELLIAFNEKTSILERITEAFVSLDANWCYTYMNKQAGEIFNRDPEKIVGKHIWTEFPEGLNQPFHLAYEKAMATQQYIHVEEHYKPYDLWFENHIYPSPDGISIFFRDVTERKKAEETILQANERFEKVTEATNDVIWDWNIESGTLFRSNAIDNFFGVGTSKILEKKNFWTDNFHKEDISKIKSSVQKALEDPDCNRWEEEYRILNNNNEIIFVIDRGLILRNKFGKAIRMVGAMTNITEQKKQEEKLLIAYQEREKLIDDMTQRNRDLEQFTFIVSHNLRAPTANIMGFAEILQDETHTPEEQKEFLLGLSTSVSSLDTVIKDINSILQVKREVNEKKELISFSKLVKEIFVSIGNIIDKHHVRIKTDFSEVDEIFSLRIYMHSIFYNLISNSIKYRKPDENPHIEIKSKKVEGKIILTFKDNGLGIDLETKGDRVFGLYKRFHSHVEGKGMGLFMVKTQVEALGGKITVVSEINKGTEFTIVLESNIN